MRVARSGCWWVVEYSVDVPLCIVESATWSLPVNQPLDRAFTPEQSEVKILEMTFALS